MDRLTTGRRNERSGIVCRFETGLKLIQTTSALQWLYLSDVIQTLHVK